MIVRFFSNFASSKELLDQIYRQTPRSFFVGKKLAFTYDEEYTHAVVLNWTKEKIKTPIANNIAFVIEPLEIRKLCDRETLKPFRYDNVCRIYTPTVEDKELFGEKHRFLRSQILLFAEFCKEEGFLPSIKPLRMSMVVSFKNLIPLHTKRLQVVQALLKTQLPIDFYGRDFTKSKDPRIKGSIPQFDKHLALRPYQFSIGLENTLCPEVLTEKFQDCIVNHTVPITNNPGAMKYFPVGSYVYIDFAKSVPQLVDDIKNVFVNEDIRKYNVGVMQAKRKILFGDFSFAENVYKALRP